MTVQLPSGAVLSVAQREAVVLVNFAGATVLHGAEADGALHRQIEEQAELLKELQAKKAQAAAKGDGHAERLNAEAVAKDMNLLRRPSPSLLRQHTKVRCSLLCMHVLLWMLAWTHLRWCAWSDCAAGDARALDVGACSAVCHWRGHEPREAVCCRTPSCQNSGGWGDGSGY